MSNSSYAKALDARAARFRLVLATFPNIFRCGGWVPLGAAHYHFIIREIPILVPRMMPVLKPPFTASTGTPFTPSLGTEAGVEGGVEPDEVSKALLTRGTQMLEPDSSLL
ncbi:hypothetical protein FB451DRAFT_1420087 [Mycena latifolia]|nr:hypothetical protein FB451DRAFT_1420087 [Mycena latifolia]